MKKKKTLQRIAAWIGIIVIVSLLVTTIILGLFGGPKYSDLFMIFLIMTVCVAVMVYVILLLGRLLNRDESETDPSDFQK